MVITAKPHDHVTGNHKTTPLTAGLKKKNGFSGIKNADIEASTNLCIRWWKEEPVSNSWFSCRALLWLKLESAFSGQMSCASSGHWRLAALWVKKMVGRPNVSTMADEHPFLHSSGGQLHACAGDNSVPTVVITSNAPDPRVCMYAHACICACKQLNWIIRCYSQCFPFVSNRSWFDQYWKGAPPTTSQWQSTQLRPMCGQEFQGMGQQRYMYFWWNNGWRHTMTRWSYGRCQLAVLT